jgi:hypothetical protein
MAEDNSGSEVQLRGPVVANKKVARGMWNAWQRTEKCKTFWWESLKERYP